MRPLGWFWGPWSQTPGTAGTGCCGQAKREAEMFTESNEENEGLTTNGRVRGERRSSACGLE